MAHRGNVADGAPLLIAYSIEACATSETRLPLERQRSVRSGTLRKKLGRKSARLEAPHPVPPIAISQVSLKS
jgi:hypothetical protein